MHRVLISPEAVHDGSITIADPSTLHHLIHVLRVQVGEALECVDGLGRVYSTTVSRRSRQALLLTVSRCADEPTPRVQMTIAQALIKPERFEWLIQKATELGVAKIIPMTTARTTVRSATGTGGSRQVRWQRIAESAAVQCGRATLPQVDAVQPFASVLGVAAGAYALLPTLTEEGPLLRTCLPELQRVQRVVVFIGPEGDFTAEEVRVAKQHGVRPVRLGTLTLRSETAAIATLAILQSGAGVL